MNCPETQAWMLHSETPAIPPAPAAEHLSRCAQCRGIHQQLMAVEGHLQSAPLPMVPVHVRDAIFAGMGPAPVRVVPVKMATVKAVDVEPAAVEPAPIKPRISIRRRRRLHTDQAVGYLVAAAASIVIGLIIGYGYGSGSRTNAPVVEAPRTKSDSPVVKPIGPREVVAADKSKPVKVAVIEEGPGENLAPGIAQVPDVAPDNSTPTTDPDVVPPPQIEAIVDAQFLTDDELLAQLVKNHTDVAAANSISQRLANLNTMASVLWTQAIKHPTNASPDRLNLVRDSYIGIVEIDLPAIARELPSDQQTVVDELIVSLEQRSNEAANLSTGDASDLVKSWKQLREASDLAILRLQKKSKDSLVRPKLDNTQYSLLPVIIEQTVWAAREDNPLERADHSTVLAEAFANDIVVSAHQGNGSRARQLGGHYGRILEDSIGMNLQQVELSKATYQQQRRYQQVLARTQQTAILLQKSLNTSRNLDVRAAFEDALRAGGLPIPRRPMPSSPIIIFHWTPGRFGHHRGR